MALADAGSFTRAAERILIAQAPSLKSAEPAGLRVTGMPSRLDSYTAVVRQLLDTAEPAQRR